MAPVHDYVDLVEPVLEGPLIALDLERLRHVAARIRQHAVRGHDGVTFVRRGCNMR